ncbi:ACB 4-hydroxyacetophenone monooxygenase [Fusarium mundagurra]|uniref:ACB 4-hydroxyacetophenone monooxygenase n=1 Tax=Fusarium mundagurra TaxID=1567541 RepID=A0A8H5XSI5_9HYPO|nr:ACB 4-hydroxyacetophenone monooxygenase [Fusarium mundagurra]
MTSMKESPLGYSPFACIGAGFSGIALGATLKRWYGITDIRFFERHSDLGGTWYANKYPGAACDVPSVLYSYSFEPNPNWSRVLPSQEELWKYQKRVADKHDLPSKMTFGVEVQKCQWIEERKRWVLDIRDYKTGDMFQHECRFLFAGSGILVTPREIDIPGSKNFKGSIFHTSQWRSDVDVKDKNVVVIGNGCTAAQIVPSIVDKTKHLTQIVRAKHWMLPPIDGPYTDFMKSVFKNLPGTMMIQRLLIFLFAEIELKAVPMTTSAAKFRQKRRAYAEKFMRDTAPAKYHDLLIPDFEIGCKRRIYDSGYLASLHSKNLTLTNERALKIVENGVETDRGFIKADVIVLANGFSTNTFLEGVEVVGRDETLTQHWESFGGAEAYNCSAMSGFPNFFMLLGPNATTGHTSAIMAIENSVNFALRILKPVLGSPDGVVELHRDAEERYVNRIQDDLSKTVWNSGCQSWYTQPHSENSRVWNAMLYPYSQGYLWYRSLFPVWRDWKITDTKEKGHQVQSMAKIYATATRVIVWLGRTTPNIDESLEVIRIAGLTATQPTISRTNHYAILGLLKAPWFQRIWVLQEVAAARHIVVKCGHAEIDGYAFFAGLGVIELHDRDYSGLRLPVLTVAYLAKGAAFRPRCATGKSDRFSLDIFPLAQLVDMFHGHQASDRRDKIYALLGMCSDDPRVSGLLVNYDISWATLFKQLVNSILSDASYVDTWDNRELAVIRIKGCVLDAVSEVSRNTDDEGKQKVGIHWKYESLNKGEFSYINFRHSAEAVMAGDVICLLQGATLPTIIRNCKDYWKIITIAAPLEIAAPLPEDPKALGSNDLLEDLLLARIRTFPHDFLLIWDWNVGPDESQGGDNYEDLVNHLTSESPRHGLKNELDRIARFWNSGVAMRALQCSGAYENFGYALQILEHVLGEMDRQALTDLGCAYSKRKDDMEKLQGTIDLLLEGESGYISLCMAAGNGYKAVVKLLLGTGKVDPDARDIDNRTPLSLAAGNGHEAIVKLLLNTSSVSLDPRRDEDMSNRHLTALRYAVMFEHKAIVELLLGAGEMDYRDYEGLSLWAESYGYKEIAELLRNASKSESLLL